MIPFGILIARNQTTARDPDESLTTIDDLQDSIKAFEAAGTPTQENINQINNYLDQLSDDKPLGVSAGAGLAVAVPLETVSMNFIARGYAEVLVRTDIAASTGMRKQMPENRYENSSVDLLALATQSTVCRLRKL